MKDLLCELFLKCNEDDILCTGNYLLPGEDTVLQIIPRKRGQNQSCNDSATTATLFFC